MSFSPDTAAEMARIRQRTMEWTDNERALIRSQLTGAAGKAFTSFATQDRANRMVQVRVEHAEAVSHPNRLSNPSKAERAMRHSRKPSREELVALWARHGTLTGCAKELGYNGAGTVRSWMRAEGIVGVLPRHSMPKGSVVRTEIATEAVLDAMERHNGSVRATAKELGCSRDLVLARIGRGRPPVGKRGTA